MSWLYSLNVYLFLYSLQSGFDVEQLLLLLEILWLASQRCPEDVLLICLHLYRQPLVYSFGVALDGQRWLHPRQRKHVMRLKHLGPVSPLELLQGWDFVVPPKDVGVRVEPIALVLQLGQYLPLELS